MQNQTTDQEKYFQGTGQRPNTYSLHKAFKAQVQKHN